MPSFYRFIFLILPCLLLTFLFDATVVADDSAKFSKEMTYIESFTSLEKDREYSEIERRIAREVIATGQMLDGDPRLDTIVSMLSQRGQGLLQGGSDITQDWVRKNLIELLPKVDNVMANAALNAATGEITRGIGDMAGDFARSAVALSSDSSGYDASGNLKKTALRSGLESVKAAAAASEFSLFNRLELEYSLSNGGIDEYSLLTVQPLWDSKDLRHNVFAQGSVANKEDRDTVNIGMGYRYITPNMRHMFGANAFFDHQWPYSHNRMSLGLDYKTSLYGASLNHYIGLSDWRGRNDGFEEKALSGTDLELSGRLPQAPEMEVFAKGFHWSQDKTAVLNPKGKDIWGYEMAAEYTPVNFLTVRSSIMNDNDRDDFEGAVTLRLNYKFGSRFGDLFKRPSYNLDSVVERRFDKVRRQNEIRVQTRQAQNVTATVTFAQGANVTVGQSIAFGTTITTANNVGDAATVVFGNGARLDMGQNTQVTIDEDLITLITGIIQFTSASGGITNLAVPGGTIKLIGTDVDLRVAGGTATLRVRDGAADFTDESGTTQVNAEELAEMQRTDALAPILRAEGTAIYNTHVSQAHAQLDLVGPTPSTPKAAPFAKADVTVTGTLSVGNVITFTVPLNVAVTVTGAPHLKFTLGGLDRLADFASGSGTNSITFTYTLIGADSTLSNIVIEEIQKNGGTLMGSNGAPMVRTVSGTLGGTVPDTIAPTIVSFTAVGSSGDPAVTGDVITITLDANETLAQSGTPTLTLDIGGVTRTAIFSVINAGNAAFTYTVQAGDNDSNGIEITAINVAADEIEDASGNDLDNTFTLPDNLTIDVVTSMMGLNACPAGDLSTPTNAGCARLFGADPTDMDDVMVYAGDVPGLTTDFFVRRCDNGMAWTGAACTGARVNLAWKSVLTYSSTINIAPGVSWDNDNARNGPNNTALLVADGSGVHYAAEACDGIPGGGWYLPGISELDVIYANLSGTDDPDHPLPTVEHPSDGDNSGTTGVLRASFITVGLLHWSSSEALSGVGGERAWMQRFSDGIQSVSSKNYARPVRCARR